MEIRRADSRPDNGSAPLLGLGLGEGLGPMLRQVAALGKLDFELQQRKLPEHERMAFVGPHICDAAADAIDRLRAEVLKWQGEYVKADVDWQDADTVADKLRAAINEALPFTMTAGQQILTAALGPNV